MSAFAVFGVSMDVCLARAYAHTKTVKKAEKGEKQGGLVVSMTRDEYEVAVRENAEKYFQRAKNRRVSPEFDTPQFAQHWVDLANRTGSFRELVVMCKVPQKSNSGSPIVRKGKQVTKWQKYTGQVMG